MNSAQLSEIVSAFQIEGKVESIESLGAGFINDTFVIRTSEGTPDYILQRKNHLIFPDVPGMMDNIDGDKYYKTAYTEHNLVRTRAQYKLLTSMERQYEHMCRIIRKYRK